MVKDLGMGLVEIGMGSVGMDMGTVDWNFDMWVLIWDWLEA